MGSVDNDIISLNWGFGTIQTVLIDSSAINFMSPGDEIHIVDNAGVYSEGCSSSNILGPVSVGKFTYNNQADVIHAIDCYKSYNNCDATGSYSWNYMNYSEIPDFVVYDASENRYFEGLFTESIPTYRGLSHHFLDSLYTGNEVFGDFNFEFNQSTTQSFYMIINASVNGSEIANDDVIGAFRNGVCVGYRNWIGNYTDIPVMGNEGGRSYAGFNEGNAMNFLYYNIEEDVYYELQPTLSYGETVFSDETIRVSNFDIIRNVSSINHFATTNSQNSRSETKYNIYRNGDILLSNYENNEFIDDNVEQSMNYCYEIAILDDISNEVEKSEPSCLELSDNNDTIAGDVNGDLVVNIVDVVMLIDMILNDNINNPSADINQDNVVNIVDIVMLVDIILNN